MSLAAAVARPLGAWLSEPVPWGAGGLRHRVPERIASRLVRAYTASLDDAACAEADSADPIEVFLRVGPRDLAVAPLALASLRARLLNVVSRVVVATPAAHVATLEAALDAVTVVADETIAAPALRDAIAAAVKTDRTTWVLQQFLSLVHLTTVARGPCLVWDADTLLIRRRAVRVGARAVLSVSSVEHHRPYFELIHALLPDLPLPVWSSMVAHHMLFEPALVAGMFEEIERACGEPWWRAILRRVDPAEASCMADYEMYGQWVRARYPERVRLAPFRNLTLSRRHVASVAAGRSARAEAAGVDSVSFHWWVPETGS